ncbi:hypothetical protein ABH963_000415 [Bacillus sp. RC55]|jgi:hypothetical protein|uniref:Uncharacterized protein n=4 Tax=Bacillus cereus group TaxID=86661 RepID=R8N4W3_BACCX|nr:hypothetical protein BG05_3850 [Bacillus mycoides]EJQ72122.1 hypothetical protein IG7_01909 [Bacillus cereus HuA2-4]EJR31678.1 hypothetical protein IIG_02763 [Bacillus cereus VD048]EJS08652.1 hypothetical protein IKO_01548 [Bacillus cereus VDM034]EJS13540.1 hypothetical protein IKS_03619 [Bacillus cereus VDM062]EOO74036.1 hypothetical protein IIC_03427 [Bacillus cereus VD021]EOP41481.1 hypothetical protein IK1_01371 [Bacillus cereus VD146]
MFYKRTIGIKKTLCNKKDAELASECEGIVLT